MKTEKNCDIKNVDSKNERTKEMKIELIGGCSESELNGRIKKVAAAGKISRSPGNVFEVIDSCDDYELCPDLGLDSGKESVMWKRRKLPWLNV